MPAPSAPTFWNASRRWLQQARAASRNDVHAALAARRPGLRELAALLSPAAAAELELLARHAATLTRRQFGATVSLYVPLYLSNHCSGGCAYCGFAADRAQPRLKLTRTQLVAELDALHAMGFEDLLLLTGESSRQAGFPYLLECAAAAAEKVHRVSVESFAMSRAQYRKLFQAGCTGVTLYQETYNPAVYRRMHRWGPKRNFAHRLHAPERALAAGMHSLGMGALLGLSDPLQEALSVFQHLRHLQTRHWQAEYSISFPRLQRETGGFTAPYPVADRQLAQMIFAFRICLPTVPLVLSTRESAAFRDGIAGLGISKMSVASRTTVGGYRTQAPRGDGQFSVNDTRDLAAFCRQLKKKGLRPVFKNWDASLRVRG